MKRILCLLLTALLLFGCSAKSDQAPAETTAPALEPGTATEEDIAQLEALYAGMEAYHGEFHDHASTGGRSDGKVDLATWKINMAGKDMDFATIVDHKQILHMQLTEWDESMFIGGSEAGTKITDLDTESTSLHYNMIFATEAEFDRFLTENDDKFNFRYGVGGESFFFADYYASYTQEELRALAAAVVEYGGFFTHVHPKGDSYLKSDNPLDYWMGDGTGLEVFCSFWGNMSDRRNIAGYELWVDILNMGKRVYATAGSDSHSLSKTMSLSTVYADQRKASSYLEQFRQGNFTAGPVGIRMSIGDTATGGTCDFTGKRLVVGVSDFHSLEFYPSTTYRLEIYNENGLVFQKEFTGSDPVYVALDAEDCKYYRADVYNVTGDYRFAVGNPIWNTNG